MKKKAALLLIGMLLAAQSVNAAERIEKEPVKVVGDSIRAPEAKRVQEEKLIKTRPGEEPKEAMTETTENEVYAEREKPEAVTETMENEAYTEPEKPEVVLETAEKENAAPVPELKGKDTELAAELLGNENLDALAWCEEAEDSEEATKRKEAVRSAAENLSEMPDSLELDGKTYTAYREDGVFGFYYDAENYHVKRKDQGDGKFFVELSRKEDNGDKIWIDGFFEEYYTDIKAGLPDAVPSVGNVRIGACGEPASMIGFCMTDGAYREFCYMVSTEKGYLKIRVMAETDEGFAEVQKVMDTFLIEGVNWDGADVRDFLEKVQMHTEDENELPEEVNAEK